MGSGWGTPHKGKEDRLPSLHYNLLYDEGNPPKAAGGPGFHEENGPKQENLVRRPVHT